MPVRLLAWGGLVCALAVVACSGEAPAAEPILQVAIPGTENPVTTTSGETTTVLMDVPGDWNDVSVELSLAAQRAGWQIESLNCVGSGNDVIAKKLADGRWLLLESGAGERGAGIIVRPAPDQGPPGRLVVTGRCPRELVESVGA